MYYYLNRSLGVPTFSTNMKNHNCNFVFIKIYIYIYIYIFILILYKCSHTGDHIKLPNNAHHIYDVKQGGNGPISLSNININ